MKKQFLAWLIPRLIFCLHHALRLSIRWEFVGERYHADMPPFLLSFWHSRILMMPYAVHGWSGPMLISEHRDGAFIADAVALMGIESSRGSSTRGGARAFLQMIRLARKGHTLGVTPDGPKGPAEVVQMGTVKLSMKSGLPIRAISYATKRHWRAHSWDRFYIPKPLTRGVFVIGEPVYPTDDEQETLALFQKEMDRVQNVAEHYFDDV